MQNTMALRPTLRLVFSAAMIFAVLAAVAGVSSALFTSAPAIASDSTITTGSADLLIAEDTGSGPGTYSALIDGADITGLTPGETEEFSFWIQNTSTDTIELDLAADLTNISDLTDTDFGTTMMVGLECDVQTTGTRDGSILAKSLGTWDTDLAALLDDGHHALSGILGPSGPADGTGTDEAKCTMTIALDEASTSDSSAASFDTELVGTQVSGT